MISVVSSDLASVGYDPPVYTLRIKFQNGSEYNYFDVPSDVYARLMKAESKGRFFYHWIRPYYKYKRIV
jgi:hypothetical protein